MKPGEGTLIRIAREVLSNPVIEANRIGAPRFF